MRVDLNTYSVNRLPFQKWYKNNKDNYPEVSKAVSVFSGSTHCPCVCLAHYLAEDIGYTPELIKVIDRLIQFYGYTEVAGQKEGSPYLSVEGKMLTKSREP